MDPKNRVNDTEESEVKAECVIGKVESPRYPPNSDDAKLLTCIIDEKLSLLEFHASNYGTLCIYKVPEKHRTKNPQAYTPRRISIGPLHYGQSQLQAMEEYKLKYLSSFLRTFRIPSWVLSEFVHTQDILVRGSYESSCIHNLKSETVQVKLSEVILLDGVFMIQLFLKNYFPEMREIGDIMFDNPWVSNDILHDLLLFENQLPLGFLLSLYDNFVRGSLRNVSEVNPVDAPPFLELVQEYFKNVGNTGKLALKPNLQRARHLVEFFAILHTDMKAKMEIYQIDNQKPRPRDEQKRRRKLESAYCPTATELSAAGVKFRRGEETCLFDIYFINGELQIPHLVINDSTETFFRNLIAFEQTGYYSRDITSYVILLDNLIDTCKDVDILIDEGIIENQLRTSDEVADVFNHLYEEVVKDPKEFHFTEVCLQLNDYSRNILHKWKEKKTRRFAMLGRDYFNSPWSSISVAAAILLLVLTAVQTVCSVLQVL